VLFTDLVDYTARVSHVDREGLRRMLREHEEVVRPIVERGGGVVVKNMGDAFLCLYPAATDALRGALEILDATEQHDAFNIRVALSTGDVEEIEGDAFGDPVNLASRVQQKTPPGQAWFSLATRLCMKDAEIPWQSVGRYQLRGISSEQECFRVVPARHVWLPQWIKDAARERRLVRLHAGEPVPSLPPEPVLLFEGFTPGSPELEETIASLPILDPASFFLAAYLVATDAREAWTEAGRGLVVGTAEAIDAALEQLRGPQPRARAVEDDVETMAIGTRLSSYLELVVCGLALPRVPFSEVVASYHYDLQRDGRWATRAEEAVLRVEVKPEGVTVRAFAPDVSLDGRLLGTEEPAAMRDRSVLATPGGAIEFRASDGSYAGVLLHDTPIRLSLMYGQTAEIGRKPNPPGLAFPAREGQGHIQWCSGARAAHARTGGFTFERALAGRRQAAIRAGIESIQLVPLHDTCATYVWREGQLARVKGATTLHIGDLVIAGTTVLRVQAPG